MKIYFGKGTTKYGPGVQIDLTGEEVARAIYTYFAAQDVNIIGTATIRVNGEQLSHGEVYVDPSSSVVAHGVGYSGRGKKY